MPSLTQYRMAVRANICVTVHAETEEDAVEQVKHVLDFLSESGDDAEAGPILVEPEIEVDTNLIRTGRIDLCVYTGSEYPAGITVEDVEGEVGPDGEVIEEVPHA